MRLRVPPRRRLLLPLLGVAHLALVAAAVSGGARVAAAAPPSLTVVDVPQPVVQVVVSEPSSTEVAVAAPAVLPSIEIAESAPAGNPDCALTDAVQTALSGDTGVRAALAARPSHARLTADALMIWDGDWVAPSPVAAATAASVRRTVRARLAVAPVSCRETVIAGPRLIYISNDGASTVLAFGSGQWSWSQLLDG